MTPHFLSGFQSQRSSRWITAAAIMAAFLMLAGCAQSGQMVDQPRYDPLSASDFLPNGQSAQNIPVGAVAYSATSSPNDPLLTAQDASGQPYKGFPMPVNKELVELGKERFDIYCVPCHGPNGEGDGKVVAFQFPKPPSLLAPESMALTNFDIFSIIADGKGKMFSYGYRVKPYERWAVIAYIRALQLKNGAVTPQELTQDQLNQIGSQP